VPFTREFDVDGKLGNGNTATHSVEKGIESMIRCHTFYGHGFASECFHLGLLQGHFFAIVVFYCALHTKNKQHIVKKLCFCLAMSYRPRWISSMQGYHFI